MVESLSEKSSFPLDSLFSAFVDYYVYTSKNLKQLSDENGNNVMQDAVIKSEYKNLQYISYECNTNYLYDISQYGILPFYKQCIPCESTTMEHMIYFSLIKKLKRVSE